MQHEAKRPREQENRDQKACEPKTLPQEVGQHRSIMAEEIVGRSVDRRVQRSIARIIRTQRQEKQKAPQQQSEAERLREPELHNRKRFMACRTNRRLGHAVPRRWPTPKSSLQLQQPPVLCKSGKLTPRRPSALTSSGLRWECREGERAGRHGPHISRLKLMLSTRSASTTPLSTTFSSGHWR